MLLLVDAGNTRIKWVLTTSVAQDDGFGQWFASGSVAHADTEQLHETWRKLDIQRVLLTNVAGTTVRENLERILLHSGYFSSLALEWLISLPLLGGVRNGYREPQQLGTDRFASAIGAHALYPEQPLIVATCGTATTIDAVTAHGLFVGGMILPGVNLMAGALARNTAQLPQAMLQAALNGDFPAFADNTEAAIISGCIAAQAGAIERAFNQFAQTSSDQPVKCILSGGAGAVIGTYLAIPHVHVDNLVLFGLQKIAYQHPFFNPSLC